MFQFQAAIFDVDGTLFDYREKKIHDSTVEAIERLKRKGVSVIIASGRSYPLLGKECMSKIPADYYVTSNGHCVQDSSGKELFAHRFTLEQTEYVVELAKKYDDGLLLKYGDYSYLYNRPEEMFQVFNNIGLDAELFRTCPSMDHHYDELPVGFTIRGGEAMKEALRRRGEEFRVELFHDESECDVFSPRRNKMTALAELTDKLGLKAEQCIAFGDSNNDIEMIRWAGMGVAMGNAVERLKNVADHVCAPSWADGIAQTVERQLRGIA